MYVSVLCTYLACRRALDLAAARVRSYIRIKIPEKRKIKICIILFTQTETGSLVPVVPDPIHAYLRVAAISQCSHFPARGCTCDAWPRRGDGRYAARTLRRAPPRATDAEAHWVRPIADAAAPQRQGAHSHLGAGIYSPRSAPQGQAGEIALEIRCAARRKWTGPRYIYRARIGGDLAHWPTLLTTYLCWGMCCECECVEGLHLGSERGMAGAYIHTAS